MNMSTCREEPVLQIHYNAPFNTSKMAKDRDDRKVLAEYGPHDNLPL